MSKKIVCIGNSTYDITFPMKKFPKENTKNRIKKIVECGGGQASNAAYLLGKWGQKPYFVGIVGNDIYGKKIKEELKGAKVNIDYMEETKKCGTTLCTIITSESSRTSIEYKNPKMKLEKKDIDINPDILLIDGQEYELSMNVIKDNPNMISIIDASRVTDEIIELCKNVNYIVCSKEFAEEVTGVKVDYRNSNTFNQIFIKLINMFPNKKYVITLEDKGSIFLDDEYVKVMPTYKMKVKDTTGAGDIFHGAFVYGLANGYTLEECVKLGNIAGALSTTKIGTRNSVPTLKEVMNLYEK